MAATPPCRISSHTATSCSLLSSPLPDAFVRCLAAGGTASHTYSSILCYVGASVDISNGEWVPGAGRMRVQSSGSSAPTRCLQCEAVFSAKLRPVPGTRKAGPGQRLYVLGWAPALTLGWRWVRPPPRVHRGTSHSFARVSPPGVQPQRRTRGSLPSRALAARPGGNKCYDKHTRHTASARARGAGGNRDQKSVSPTTKGPTKSHGR